MWSEQNYPPWVITIGDTVLFAVVIIGVFLILSLLFRPVFGNSGINDIADLYTKHPFELIVGMVFVGPLFEELVFRLPALFFLNSSNRTYWIAGTISSIAFALMHGTERLPLPQFMFGMFFWHLVKKRGYGYNVIAHMTINAMALLALVLLHYMRN